ncbi:MAG: primosomal protein N' [Desulfuromonadales bacterium]|nr:primosomal protein N' [Desulfuromonadales bacterium]
MVEVAVTAPINKTLHYSVPQELMASLCIGSRVRVPLGRRQVVGYAVAWGDTEQGLASDKLKAVLEVVDAQPLFHAAQAAFYLRAAEYYAYPPGEAVRTALPAGLSDLNRAPSQLSDRLYCATGLDGLPTGAKQREILAAVVAEGEARLSQLRQRFDNPHAPLKRLVELGFLSVEEVELCRDPFADTTIAPHQPVQLNPAQQEALSQIDAKLTDAAAFAPFLLYGVTGSGKTEVYLRSIAIALEQQKQVLLLVPEIALTPQLVGRFRSWFQEHSVRLAVLHSGLNEGERYDAWRQIVRGDIDVVIGARSAIFAPLPNLGLILVDEEHDGSYKQSESFRYNARDLALLRGKMEQAVVVLGSATPALTTWRLANDGPLTLLSLPQRTSERAMPQVELLDLAETAFAVADLAEADSVESDSSENDAAGASNERLLSQPLVEAVAQTLEAGEQTLLLLNRRGYAPYLLCHDCGATLRCPNCEITLTYSQVQRSLRCHYCDYRIAPPTHCQRCDGVRLLPQGGGAERLEEDVCELFPDARVARMDRDTTSRKGAHAVLIERMMSRQIDILIGTQMIAKGHDFPAVTLVGVLNADAALNLPDFRSAERVYALLSQVAGRAGRGERPGRVLIQTYASDSYALDFVLRHDYAGFAEVELEQRRALDYPPFGHLVNLVLSGNDEAKVQQAATNLAEALEALCDETELLGPAPCLLSRLRNKHRYQILLKSLRRQPLRRQVVMLDLLRKHIPAGVRLNIDVDPLDMF